MKKKFNLNLPSLAELGRSLERPPACSRGRKSSAAVGTAHDQCIEREHTHAHATQRNGHL